MAPTLKTKVTGIEFENPYLLGSGPPGTNAKVIAKSFDLGWGGVVGKTISLDASKVVNTAPRYGKLKDPNKPDVVVGFENIELISDRPYATWLDEFRQLTGIGGVVNTSLNLHGDPLVHTPLDAVTVLERSELRHLALNEFLVQKADRVQ